MSILIQAGHQSSYSDNIMQKLYERGLSQPFDSFTHHMNPQQTTDVLCKIISRESTPAASNKLTDNLMVDLLLSNIEQPNWGWHAENNLFTMHLWHQLEPETAFILVFDHPGYLLTSLANETLSVDTVNEAMTDWIDYHQKILEVFETYQHKALLIEGSSAIDNISTLGMQIKSVAPTLHLKSKWQIAHELTSSALQSKSDNQADVASTHINNEILKKYPKAIKLFNKLLDNAAIKSSEPIYKSKPAELDTLVTALSQLYEKPHDKQALLEEAKVIEKLHQTQEQLEKQLLESEHYQLPHIQQLEQQLQVANQAWQQAETKLLTNQKLIDEYKLQIDTSTKRGRQIDGAIDTDNSAERLKQENKALVKMLHHTQEKLEKTYSENQKLTTGLINQHSNAIDVIQHQKQAYYNAADRIKNDLPYRLGSTLVKSKSFKNTILLPVTLCREYIDYKSIESELINLPPISSQTDILESEKIKRHLSYKVGNALVDGIKDPKNLIKAPKVISKEIYEFRKKDNLNKRSN